jgi:hypothetical protein
MEDTMNLRLKIIDRLLSVWPEFRKNGEVSNLCFTVNCPTLGCDGTVRIRGCRDIDRICRGCASKRDRSNDQTRKYNLYTTNIEQAHLNVSKNHPDRFIREEISEDGKSYVAVMKCGQTDCNREIRIRNNQKPGFCGVCGLRKRPYERLFNNSQKNRDFVKNNGTHVKWLITYEEFVTLCKIKNCHYCNSPLDRAPFRNAPGSTALLLDRKDSNGSYEVSNCVPCCAVCNFTKNEHISYDEMIAIMRMRNLWIPK